MFKKLILVLAALIISASAGNAAPDSKGTDFWLAFPGQLIPNQLTLFIAGEVATSGNVSIPGMGFSQNFNVTPGQVTVIQLPVGAQASTVDGVENKAIHVTSLDEITVYGLNRGPATTDAYMGIPTDILGLEYIVLGFGNVNIVNGTEFAVTATENNTTVTITPSVTTGTRTVGVPYNIVLNQGQAYQLRNTGAAPNDLSGTIVTADKRIAVFGGHQCANIPDGGTFACDHIVEELPPTETWGKNFVTIPLATRENGDTFRFLASTDGTNVTVNGTLVATLNRGQFHQRTITTSAVITSDKPILVAQYSNGCSFDPPPNCRPTDGDPFMMLIPPFEQFLGQYTVSTADDTITIQFPANFINVVAPTAAAGSITLDGVPIPAANFTAIGPSGFSGAQIPVSRGTHNLNGPLPFGAFMYGFGSADSYGYPGGMSLAPVARVTNLSLAPKTATNPVGTEHCVVATVTDQNSLPLEGVRVDFNITGANPTAGFANTNADGQAQFCYTGTNAGQDSIEASVGEIFDTATKDWTDAENAPPVADPQSITTDEDTPKTVTLTGSDADNDPLTFDIVTPPQHGTLSEANAVTKRELRKARRDMRKRLMKERKIPGTWASTLRRKDIIAFIRSLLANSVVYTPDPNFHGSDSFTFKVNDGKTDSAPATVNIEVAPAPDAPEIQNLIFARRSYSTPGIAAILEFRDIDGDNPITLDASLTARNVPKGCGSEVLPSDPASIVFSEIVNDPDFDPLDFEQTEFKVLEIGPDALNVAAEHGCQVTLELTTFSVQGVDPSGRTSNVLSGSFSIDSDNGQAPVVNRQLFGGRAPKKIAPPVVR